MSAKRCVRCNAEVFGRAEDQPHLCKDIAKRLARRERQVQAVDDILAATRTLSNSGNSYIRNMLAREIVAKLAGMGVDAD